MLLVVDIGNTNTVLGIFDGDRLLHHWRLMSGRRTSDELGIYLLGLFGLTGVDTSEITGAAVSSVVPPLNAPWREGLRRYLGVECLMIHSGLDMGISVDYVSPSEVGADRLVNAVAGVHKYGAPLIIVDFGTAITLDAISRERKYLGGAIAPGLSVSMEALYGKTAKLPKVSFDAPDKVVGRNTMESIQSGLMHGFAGLVDSLAKKIRLETGEGTAVIATGGQAEAIATLSETIEHVEPWLTLEGLRLLYGRNADGGAGGSN